MCYPSCCPDVCWPRRSRHRGSNVSRKRVCFTASTSRSVMQGTTPSGLR